MNLGGIFHVRGSSQAVNRSMAARVTHWHPKRQNHTASPCSSWTMPIYSLPACLEQECKHSLGFMCSSNLSVYPGQTLGEAAWSWKQPETEMQVHLVPAVLFPALCIPGQSRTCSDTAWEFGGSQATARSKSVSLRHWLFPDHGKCNTENNSLILMLQFF